MTVELERKFYKWYKRINISCDEQKTTNRWDGIQNAVGLFENLVDISGLLKIYYRLSFDVSIKDQFVECFATEDKSFDETNEEEMVILAGGVLAQLLGQENNIFVAYSLLILDTYYEAPLKELSDMASSVLSDMSKEIKKSEESNLDTIKKIDLKEVEEIISETSDLTEEGVDKLVTIIKLYLAALWHSVIQTEMPIKFKLKRMEKDTQYLYSLEKKWLAVEPLERTVIGQEVSELTLLLTDGNQDLEVEFPDLSGETFQNIYENREMSQHLYQKICDANAILYFINVENIYHGQLISEVSEEIRNAGQEEYRERKPSQDDPTQIQIIDLLQAIAEIKRSQVKLGIIFSAWDLIDDMENVNPRKYLKNNMNMLWQYLEANCRKFDIMKTFIFLIFTVYQIAKKVS